MTEGAAVLRTVRLEDLPVAALLELRRHVDDLLHELRVVGSGMATGAVDTEVPRRLAALIEELNERFASQRLIGRRLLDEAAERGDETVSLELMLPVEAAGAVERYMQLLDEADEYCRTGELLTLALPPALVELRRQVLDEIINQLR
jgi:hypothetical protein